MKEMYDWVAWHRELAKKIAEGGRDYLVEKIGRVAHKQALGLAKLGRDPLSFFDFLRNSQSESNEVCEAVQDVFELVKTKLPDPGELRDIIFPSLSESLSREGAMFPVGNDDLLWRLFEQATKDNPDIKQEDWKATLDIDGVEVGTLTLALFLVNPDLFFPVDSAVDACFPEGWREEKEKKIEGDGGYEEYLSAQEEIKELFPECEPYEIWTFLRWQKDKGAISKDSKFFQISTNAHGDGRDFWDKDDSSDDYIKENNFKENNWIFVGGAAPDGKGFWEDVEGLPWEDVENKVKEKGSRPYPLLDPKRGDVILVRYGNGNGKGIGVILKNDYDRPDGSGLKEESKIHVLWINKSKSPVAGVRSGALIRARLKTCESFANEEAYKSSFQLINQLTGKTIGNGKQVDQDRQHPLNTILYGPPGTGKTYNTSHYAVAIIEGKSVEKVKGGEQIGVKRRFDKYRNKKQIEMVTFHQNYAYEDFIEGIRPVLSEEAGQGQEIEYELSQGIFKEISNRAEEKKAENYVLIIDEINRGNIAKIFGELITLIEESRRLGRTGATEVTLPYSGKSFGVPDNLYIIGTMNTADRSIALLDTALRRRFEFKEMMPDPSQIKKDIEGVNLKELLEKMNERIRVMIDREHQTGHTYFFDVEDMESLKKTFQNKIIPLLQEYFYDDYEKINLVLNNNGFIKKAKIPNDLFVGSDLIDEDRYVHELLPFSNKKWEESERYQSIYKSNSAQSQEQNKPGDEE